MAAIPAASLGKLADFEDRGVAEADFLAEVVQGLQQPQKRIPPKFFYDAEGSRLFDQICVLDEYYPTRTEVALLQRHGGEIADLAGAGADLIEFGSGSNIKAGVVLAALERPRCYVPIDISREHLLASSRELAAAHPQVAVIPVCADYTRPLALPAACAGGARLGFFPGSSIGNFRPADAAGFLRRAAGLLGGGQGLLIGVDRKKDTARLEAAYDDARGVTAAFNRNLLVRMKRELGADVDPGAFRHHALYNGDRGRIEMHLVSERTQTISVGGHDFHFSADESIHTEDSFKYTPDEFAGLAAQAGWCPQRHWSDAEDLFSLHYLTAA